MEAKQFRILPAEEQDKPCCGPSPSSPVASASRTPPRFALYAKALAVVVLLVFGTVFLTVLSTSPETETGGWPIRSLSRRQVIHRSGPGGLRCIVRRRSGDLLGLWIAGEQMQTWISSNEGAKWQQLGSVATVKKKKKLGDPNLLVVPGTRKIFASHRVEHADGSFQVVISRSDNNGVDWKFDSTAIGPVDGHFVGAPFLFLTRQGNLQCYFDNEQLPATRGHHGTQWITMKQRRGLSGSWNANGLVVVGAPAGFVRDGMPTVVQLDDPKRLMVVMEGILEEANVVHAVQSFDYGKTWDRKTRTLLHNTKRYHGRLYNSYVPFALKPAMPGPVFVTFCTDEDSSRPPDVSSTPPDKRTCTVKMVRTAETFEKWTGETTIYEGKRRNYFPGLFALKDGTLISTVLEFGAGIVVTRV